MIRKAALAVAVVAALAAAAIFRPPRAAPALSYTGQPAAWPGECVVPGCHPERSERKRAKSKDRAHRAHQRRSRRHDLNHADAATIARIPGVGEWLAQRIVDYRAMVGPFESLDDLSDLDGISATRLASLGRYAVVR
jgi:DNA uptake protein ComE-like DNA-binding protein